MVKGLYIHIPFCKSKCFYCDFCSYSGKEKLMTEYAKALAKELDDIGAYEPNTIFIGGGTPTYLTKESWKILGNSISRFNTENLKEFTVEANPGTFDSEILSILKQLGANRLSIGLQAVQDKHLKNLGRIHTWADFKKGYKLARKTGFGNINVDLIFGIPDQTLDEWKESLKAVVDLEPEHISCYSLIVEENTEFHKRYEKSQLNLPDEETEMDMYRYSLEFLEKHGYKQYEISNFARPGKECRHNLIYWNLEEYLGCGAAAHSYLNGKRWSNCDEIEGYIESIKRNPVKEVYENTKEDEIEEFIFMGLRKITGISIKDFETRFGENIFNIYGNVIDKYLENSLIEISEGHIKLTAKGIEVSNTVMSDFIF